MSDRLGFDGYDAEVFCHVISEMDSEIMTIRAKEMDQRQQQRATKAKK